MTLRASHSELLHLVARAAEGARPLRTRTACVDLWQRLGARFDVVACVLMPDHVHLLVCAERDVARRAFAQVLSSFRARAAASREHECAPLEWEPLPQPEKVQRDPRHIARTIRYIHLNPCRDALCDDPLEWEWSTHRDWVGAVARPCVHLARWGRLLRRPVASPAGWLHEYVSSDPSVRRPRALADPRPWLAAERLDASLAMLAAAVPRVLRSRCIAPAAFDVAARRLFVLAAERWTRYSAAELARRIGRDPTSVRRLLRVGRASAAGAGREGLPEGLASGSVALAGARARVSDPLSGEELRAMALTLADSRLRWEFGGSK